MTDKDFKNIYKKIENMKREEIEKIICKCLEDSGIEYEKGCGKIIFDGIPEIYLEDIFDSIKV